MGREDEWRRAREDVSVSIIITVSKRLARTPHHPLPTVFAAPVCAICGRCVDEIFGSAMTSAPNVAPGRASFLAPFVLFELALPMLFARDDETERF